MEQITSDLKHLSTDQEKPSAPSVDQITSDLRTFRFQPQTEQPRVAERKSPETTIDFSALTTTLPSELSAPRSSPVDYRGRSRSRSFERRTRSRSQSFERRRRSRSRSRSRNRGGLIRSGTSGSLSSINMDENPYQRGSSDYRGFERSRFDDDRMRQLSDLRRRGDTSGSSQNAERMFASRFEFGKIMLPYKDFIHSVDKNQVLFKTRFGIKKLHNDKIGLYLSENKKNYYLYKWENKPTLLIK